MSASQDRLDFKVAPGGRLEGRLRMPGDKSISHRAIMLGAIAEGTTDVSGFLEGEDCMATLGAFRAMGVDIDGPEAAQVTVHGVGLDGLQAPSASLDLGNSGTSMRLLAGLLAGQRFDSTLTGDQSLSRRPMRRVVEPLSMMGANITTAEDGRPPLRIMGGRRLRGIHYDMPVASAQVKSSLLLAGLYAQGRTCVCEPAPTRDHTERMLRSFGCRLEADDGCLCAVAGSRLHGMPIEVPGDLSAAAFFIVGATIAEGSDVVLEQVGVNPTRTGVIEILRLMGADIVLTNEQVVGGEPVADIRVRSAPLQGIAIPQRLVSLAIDEFPVIFVAAACAQGETSLTGASELRVKESDRIQVMADGLQACGILAEPKPDGIMVRGGVLSGATVASRGDHRVAMAFAVAALRGEDTIVIEDCANVNTSFPGFVQVAQRAGLSIATVTPS